MTDKKQKWIPEILYPENHGTIGGAIPLISVPEGETMPKILFIWEDWRFGPRSPDEDPGDGVPEATLTLHSYFNAMELGRMLDEETYQKVRTAMGLSPSPKEKEDIVVDF